MTHFVAGLGTHGTFTGTTRGLKQLNPAIQAISMQPDSFFHGLEGLKQMATAIVPAIQVPTLAAREEVIVTVLPDSAEKYLNERIGEYK